MELKLKDIPYRIWWNELLRVTRYLDGGYKREFHLCDKCGDKYDMSGAI
jgi:hypothetical protein